MPPGWPKLSQAGVGYAHLVCLAEACDQHPASTTATPANLTWNLQTIRPTNHTTLPSESASRALQTGLHNGGQILVLPHNILAQVSRPPDWSHVGDR